MSLEALPLEMEVKVRREGKEVPEEIELQLEMLNDKVNIGSYNLVKAVLKNKAEYYAATTLRLATPEQLQIIGKNKHPILLSPLERRETLWIVKVSEGLDENYRYDFPMVVYSEKNTSIQKIMQAQEGEASYSEKEIRALTIRDEEKAYSQQVSFDCSYPSEIKQGSSAEVSCSVLNKGNMDLKAVFFCLGEVCRSLDLPASQKEELSITIEGKEAGWKNVMVTAENEMIEKKSSLAFLVLDEPALTLEAKAPEVAQFGQTVTINLTLTKDSINPPRQIVLILKGLGQEQRLEMEQLLSPQQFQVELDGKGLASRNEIKLELQWEDKEGKAYREENIITVQGKSNGFSETIRMWMNKILRIID